MAGEALTINREPLVELDNLGTSLDQINQLVMPIHQLVLRGVRYGETQSLVRGQGTERDGVRDYVIGDDPRYIDWNITARSADGSLKLRQHIRDITPSLWLVTDLAKKHWRITPGMAYPAQRLGMSAVFAMQLLAEREDMPSGILASNDFERFETDYAKIGSDHIFHTSRRMAKLIEAEPASRAEQQRLSGLLQCLGGIARESLVIIVSDFRDIANPSDELNGWKKPLQQLKAQGNDVVAIEINNPDQNDLSRLQQPAIASGVFHKGFGREARRIDAEYARLAKDNQVEIDAVLKSVGAAHIKLSTDEKRWFTSLRLQLAKAAERARH